MTWALAAPAQASSSEREDAGPLPCSRLGKSWEVAQADLAAPRAPRCPESSQNPVRGLLIHGALSPRWLQLLYPVIR